MIVAALLSLWVSRHLGFGLNLSHFVLLDHFLRTLSHVQISLSWLVSTSLLFFWPTAFPVTAANMNWSGVLLAIFLILATVQVCLLSF